MDVFNADAAVATVATVATVAADLPDGQCARHAEITRYCRGVYGEAAGAAMERYVQRMAKACESAPLSIYQSPRAAYITDELVDECERLFEEAMRLAENETYRARVEREYLAVRFLRITRLPLDTPGRDELIEKFFDDVKGFGITEIRERRSLASSKQLMKEERYVETINGYSLYYIMQ